MIKITRDSNANLKILKRLEKDGLIEIHDVKGENETKKVKNQVLPIAVLDATRLDECLLAGSDCSYDSIREIIGRENVWDAIKLEAHIRNEFDYFITEDRDFLDKKDELKNKFGVQIFTSEALEKFLCNKLEKN